MRILLAVSAVVAVVAFQPTVARAGACPSCTTNAECEALTGAPAFCVLHDNDVGCGTVRQICCPGQGCNVASGRPSCETAGTCTVVGGSSSGSSGATSTANSSSAVGSSSAGGSTSVAGSSSAPGSSAAGTSVAGSSSAARSSSAAASTGSSVAAVSSSRAGSSSAVGASSAAPASSMGAASSSASSGDGQEEDPGLCACAAPRAGRSMPAVMLFLLGVGVLARRRRG